MFSHVFGRVLCGHSYEGNNAQRLVATSHIKADFILPVIAATPASVAFEFVKTPGSAEFEPETKVRVFCAFFRFVSTFFCIFSAEHFSLFLSLVGWCIIGRT